MCFAGAGCLRHAMLIGNYQSAPDSRLFAQAILYSAIWPSKCQPQRSVRRRGLSPFTFLLSVAFTAGKKKRNFASMLCLSYSNLIRIHCSFACCIKASEPTLGDGGPALEILHRDVTLLPVLMFLEDSQSASRELFYKSLTPSIVPGIVPHPPLIVSRIKYNMVAVIYAGVAMVTSYL